MDIPELVNITSKAWALTVLALLHSGVPGRQAPLLKASGAGRTAFTQSLDHLVEIGLLERNPGHGHPLRPEFRLTAAGKPAAALAHRILVDAGPGDPTLLRRTWTVPILVSLHRPRHFSEIKGDLPVITDRALSQSLKSMEALDWVQRSVDDAARPPRPLYRAVNAGLRISRAILPGISPYGSSSISQ